MQIRLLKSIGASALTAAVLVIANNAPAAAAEVPAADDGLCGDEPHPAASNNAASGTAASTAPDEASARNETGQRADRCFCKPGRMLCASWDAYAVSLGS